jgi:hypothetical protein
VITDRLRLDVAVRTGRLGQRGGEAGASGGPAGTVTSAVIDGPGLP